MKLPTFALDRIADPGVKNLLDQLRQYLISESQLQGFKFYEVEIKAAQTDFKLSHDLGYQPKDIILTSVSNSAVVSFSYDKFTSAQVVLTIDKAATLRFFAGTYDGTKS